MKRDRGNICLVHERGVTDVLSPVTKRAARVLQEKLDLPEGYYVKYDENTENIIVANEKLGFCVTGRYIKDHPNEGYLDAVKKNLAHLRQMTDDPELVRLLTPQEMYRQAPTRFD